MILRLPILFLTLSMNAAHQAALRSLKPRAADLPYLQNKNLKKKGFSHEKQGTVFSERIMPVFPRGSQ